jgi:hypothetical protein
LLYQKKLYTQDHKTLNSLGVENFQNAFRLLKNV